MERALLSYSRRPFLHDIVGCGILMLEECQPCSLSPLSSSSLNAAEGMQSTVVSLQMTWLMLCVPTSPRFPWSSAHSLLFLFIISSS